MPRKSPAATAASGARITTADVEAAERDRIVAASLRLQQAMAAPPPPSDGDTAKVLAALDRLERRPTSDELASQRAEDRRRYVERRNTAKCGPNRALAGKLRASGYQGWTGGGEGD